jgi:hypothetical protein
VTTTSGSLVGWRRFAVVQAVGAIVALVLWVVLHAGQSNVGGTLAINLLADGGPVVLAYLAVLIIAAIAMFRGIRGRGLAVLEATAVLALLPVVPLSVQEVSRGGSPDFYYGLAGLALGAAIAVAVVAWRLARSVD